jgi:hypothetical protein
MLASEWAAVAQPILARSVVEIDAFTDTQTFALFWFLQEMKERNTDIRACMDNEEQSAQLYIRLLEWAKYRLMMHAFIVMKECPKAAVENRSVSSAAFAAMLVKTNPSNPKLTKFLADCESDHQLHINFIRELGRTQRSPWKYPLIDTWLFSIWPIVIGYNWSNRDVWMAATSKFTEITNARPLDTADGMAEECERIGLKAPGSTRGRPGRDTESKLPQMAGLALRIPAELPDDCSRD